MNESGTKFVADAEEDNENTRLSNKDHSFSQLSVLEAPSRR